jgi:hypothetical protein
MFVGGKKAYYGKIGWGVLAKLLVAVLQKKKDKQQGLANKTSSKDLRTRQAARISKQDKRQVVANKTSSKD